MKNMNNLHNLTHSAIEELQQAFAKCQHKQTEGVLLSTLVTVKQIHDSLFLAKEPRSEFDPEELCAAV